MLHPKTKYKTWPSGAHKPVMAVSIHPTEIADQIGTGLNEGWMGDAAFTAIAFDVDGIGPVIMEYCDGDAQGAVFYVDSEVEDEPTAETLMRLLSIEPEHVIWSVLDPD